jgi:hypothetical protein
MGLFDFLRDESNLKILTWIGGGVAVLAGALWTVFTFFFREKGRSQKNVVTAQVYIHLAITSITPDRYASARCYEIIKKFCSIAYERFKLLRTNTDYYRRIVHIACNGDGSNFRCDHGLDRRAFCSHGRRAPIFKSVLLFSFLIWALIRDNIGNALSKIGAMEDNVALLEEAVSAHREALIEKKRKETPLEWADVQAHLAGGLFVLGVRTNNSGLLN